MRAVTHFIARSRYLWVALCILTAIILLIALAWPTQGEAWEELRRAEVPLWAILGGFALVWLGNGKMWGWIAITGVAASLSWDAIKDRDARYERADKRPSVAP